MDVCGVTRKNKIRSEYIRGAVGLVNIPSKATERLLQWFGHVTRRPLGHACKQIMDMKPPGKRPRTMWMDSMDRDMKDYRSGLGLLQEDH